MEKAEYNNSEFFNLITIILFFDKVCFKYKTISCSKTIAVKRLNLYLLIFAVDIFVIWAIMISHIFYVLNFDVVVIMARSIISCKSLKECKKVSTKTRHDIVI